MAVKKIKSKINTWKPKKDEIIVERDGKLFICNFDKVFGHNENLKPYNRFLIGKESYINQLDTITAYTNFFINNYDFDKELPMGYLKVKFALDKEKIYNLDNLQSYIDFLYQVLFTDTMVEKIIQMVEENYLDDIETPGEEKKKYIKNEKKHLESLEFTNQHIKILLQISFGMKLMSPCIFHYVQINNIKIEKDSDIIFRFYKKLFSIFGFTTNYELRNNKNELIESDITPDELRAIVEEKGLKPIKIGDGIRYYFKGDDGETVQEDNHIDALFITCPDLLHNGENVHAVLVGQIRVESGCGLGVHQVQVAVGDFDAVFQHLDQAATGLGSFRIDEADNGVLQVSLINLAEIVHCVRLGAVQEFEQQFPVNSEQAVKVGCFADDVTITFTQPFQEQFLIFFFGKYVMRCLHLSGA